MDDYDSDLDNVANDIISQIKNQGKSLKKAEKIQRTELASEDVDDFIRTQASQVILDAAEVIGELKDVITSGASPNDVIAFSELLNAFTHAMEVLNKKQIADSKNKTQKEIKVMDIESKKEIAQEDNTNRIMLSQNEIIKEMLALSNKDESVKLNKTTPIIDV